MSIHGKVVITLTVDVEEYFEAEMQDVAFLRETWRQMSAAMSVSVAQGSVDHRPLARYIERSMSSADIKVEPYDGD